MKIRTDFVTNSSSSSYIICFARIADEEKANKIIEKHNLRVFTKKDVEHEMRWSGSLGADWAGATLWNTKDVLKQYPDEKYIIIEDSNDAYDTWDEEYDYYDTIYDYNFAMNDAIDEITEENGFADIESAEGEGRDG